MIEVHPEPDTDLLTLSVDGYVIGLVLAVNISTADLARLLVGEGARDDGAALD